LNVSVIGLKGTDRYYRLTMGPLTCQRVANEQQISTAAGSYTDAQPNAQVCLSCVQLSEVKLLATFHSLNLLYLKVYGWPWQQVSSATTTRKLKTNARVL